MRFIKNNILGILWSWLTVVLSLMPGKDLPQVDLVNFDKFAHFSFYGIFYLVVRLGLERFYGIPTKYAAWTSVLYTGFFGLAMEYCQDWFTQRHFDWYDALANILGVVFVAIIVLTTPKLKHLFTKT